MGSEDTSSRRYERRRAPRYEFCAGLEIEWGSAVLRGQTRDVSASGMFIESPDPLWVGAGFIARLMHPYPLKLDCFVKRVEPGRGMGVSVKVTEDQNPQLYQNFIAALARPQT